jgi:signal transduction histidine kinase
VRSVVITSSAPSGDEGGRQFQVMRDETELEATRRLRDAVIANISHEFRTPLSAQLASIEMLRDRLGEGDNPDVVALVLSLERGTLRLAQLIDNLLESVRIEGGQDSIRRRPVALDEVVQEAAALTGPLIEQRRQRLLVELPYPLPPVTGDATRLVQVFVNLLANANKFAPAGSAISVGGAVEGGEVVLWVEDEGPGLPVGRGSTVFDRFVRAPGRTDEDEPEQSGMGLGLWIVRSIVERHGGRVEARVAGGGAAEAGRPGTRICVILPGNGRNEDPGR